MVFIGQDDAVPSWLDGSSPTVSEPLRDREECRTAHTLADCAPFLQIRYRGTPELPDEATIAFEWKGEGDADFSPERRIEISAHHPDPWERASKLQHCLVEAWKHPGWKGKISAFRFILPPGAAVQARKIAESDFALATTGIAGPGGGSEAKPVATVFIALADKEGVKVCRYFYPTDREAFKFLVTQTALNLLRERLLQIEED